MPLFTRPQNCLENSIGLLQNVIVPEAQDFPTKPPQVSGSLEIGGAAVLASIGLDDEPTFSAREVRDAASDRFLPPELKSAYLAITKMKPQPSFGVGRFAPQPARVGI